MIVQKFGGSSVDSAPAIERVVGLVRERLGSRPVVVVSAMAKTTRQLLASAGAAGAGDLAGAREILAEIRDLHERESRPVVAPGSLDALFAAHFGELRQALQEIAAAGRVTPRAADRIAGYGELLSSAILTESLRRGGVDAVLVDCRRVIVTDDTFTRALPDYPATDERLRAALSPLLAAGSVPVLGGYAGATADGIPSTLGKEGSDFSAAIVGAALGAEEVQIWTDVDGILTADPQLVPGARPVAALTFAEALELACSGSKKPHPGTLGPARKKDVPVRILNSRHPKAPGTLIGRRDAGGEPRIRSIALRSHAHLLHVQPLAAHAGNGFLLGVLELCERFRPALLVLDADAA
ncbi:MAG TPA: aspartate kinase, partial [Thermoanaerobaculia bacterium]|nr:aspartate kinase [Thermoanaerobaculia bacterium]